MIVRKYILLLQLRQVRPSLAVLQMSRDDVSERVTIEELICKRKQVHDLAVQVRTAEGEHVESEFESLSVVALVVGELHQHDDLHERVGRRVALLVRLCCVDLRKYLLQTR